ncbi:hypothetical protein OF868_18280 [Escherichia coli]|nr:hypothetical protein OF868_18280 [Escherichia coli]
MMAEKLSTWKFILIWLVFVIMACGYFIGQIRWGEHKPNALRVYHYSAGGLWCA